MRTKASTKKASRARVVPPLFDVVHVKALPDYRLQVRFEDGTEGLVDLRSFLFAANAGVFEHLRDPAEFRKVRVRSGAVTWPGELDLAPDAMYDEIKVSARRRRR
jgi:hypothetical protein